MQPRGTEGCLRGMDKPEHCSGKVTVTGQGTDWERGKKERGWSRGMSRLVAYLAMSAFPTAVETQEWEPWGW